MLTSVVDHPPRETPPASSPPPPCVVAEGDAAELTLPPSEKDALVDARSPASASPADASELYGLSLMALSTIGLSGMSVFARMAETHYAFAPTSCLFLRGFVQASLALSYLLLATNVRQTLLTLSSRQLSLLALRGLVGAASLAAVFIALRYIPAGDATAMFFLCPVLTLLLSNAVLRERAGPADAAAAAVSLLGVIVMTRADGGEVARSVGGSERVIGSAAAVLAAVFAAVSYVTVRQLGASIHFMTSVLALGVVATAFGTASGGASQAWQAVYGGGGDDEDCRLGAMLMLVSALFAFAGQCCLNLGLQHCGAGRGALIRNLDVPMVYALGIVLLHERPTPLRAFAAALIVLSAVSVAVRKLLASSPRHVWRAEQ